MQPCDSLFSAQQIAAALGRTKRAVQLALVAVKPADQQIIRGQYANAWSFCSLPALMQRQIENAAQERGYRNAEALLEDCGRPSITPCEAIAAVPPHRDTFSELDIELKSGLPSASALKPEDRWWVWRKVCPYYTDLLTVTPADGRRLLRASLVQFLLRTVPGLVKAGSANSIEALDAALRRALDDFENVGLEGMRDLRSEKSGNRHPELCPDCWHKALALDVKSGGNECLAWRLLKTKNQLCPECAARHHFDSRYGKSEVPRSIRQALTPLAEAAKPWLISEAAGRAAGPHPRRVWSNEKAGNVIVADDVKFNIKVWWQEPDGVLNYGRPECLYMADELTGKCLAFDLICRAYNGIDIAKLKLRCHDKVGLPRYEYKFENGVWLARAVDADKSKEFLRLIRDCEEAMQLHTLYKVRVSHFKSRNPESKVIEGDFLIHQRLQTLWPGHVGFREREERSDAEKKFEAAVKHKQNPAHPGEKWLSLADFRDKLSLQLEEFNEEPRGGRLGGRTPNEVWAEDTNEQPLRRLEEKDRWMISTNVLEKYIGPQGFNIGKHHFADGQLALLQGKTVTVIHHHDCLSLAHVRHPDTGKMFPVKENVMVAHPKTEEDKAQAQETGRQIRDFNRVAKVLADTIRHPVINIITKTRPSGPPGEEFGSQMERDKKEHVDQTRRQTDARTRQKSEARRALTTALADMESLEKGTLP
jgi:hypothetical protein